MKYLSEPAGNLGKILAAGCAESGDDPCVGYAVVTYRDADCRCRVRQKVLLFRRDDRDIQPTLSANL